MEGLRKEGRPHLGDGGQPRVSLNIPPIQPPAKSITGEQKRYWRSTGRGLAAIQMTSQSPTPRNEAVKVQAETNPIQESDPKCPRQAAQAAAKAKAERAMARLIGNKTAHPSLSLAIQMKATMTGRLLQRKMERGIH